MKESNGEEDLTYMDPNEEYEVQGRGYHAQIFTKTREKREEMMDDSFLGLDLMKPFFGIKNKKGKMKRGRRNGC